MSESDRRLRELLQELRTEETARAPSFEHVLAAARGARRRPRLLPALVATVLVAAVAAAVLWQVTLPSPGEVEAGGELAASLSGWRGPLDFLLDVPGGELLGSEPALPGSVLTLPELSDPSLIDLREAI